MAQGNSPTTRVMHATPAADRAKIEAAVHRAQIGTQDPADIGILATAAALYLAVLPPEPAPPATDAPYSFWCGELHGENRRVLEHRHPLRQVPVVTGTGRLDPTFVWSDYDPDVVAR